MKSALMAAVVLTAAPSAAMADSTAYNVQSTPDFFRFTSGLNNAGPAAVLTTDNGNAYLRAHVTYGATPDGTDGLYKFTGDQFSTGNAQNGNYASGAKSLAIDFGVSSSSVAMSSVSGTVTITDLGSGVLKSFSLADLAGDPDMAPYTNADGVSGMANSERVSWPLLFGPFDPTANDTYQVDFDVTGLGTDPAATSSLRIFAQLNDGAVPEPATWAMMIAGFGMTGAALRRRRVAVRFA